MEMVIFAISIVAVCLFLNLLQETITRKNAIDNLKSANQTIADMTGELSIVTRERNDAVDELEKVAKERDELKAKLCEMKTANFELLNCKIHKGGMLARIKSIIDEDVDE